MMRRYKIEDMKQVYEQIYRECAARQEVAGEKIGIS